VTTLCCQKISPAIYKPRKPEKTVLFQVIKKHYKTWHKNAQKAIPSHIDKEFQQYIQCGILAHGFACAHCHDCHQDFLIAFSCKGRGICPSCNTRRMVETAAHLIENLMPAVSMRQWVISFPKRIRHYLQTDAILQKVLRIVVDEVRKKIIACSPKIIGAQFGAISFIQRFGTTLNFHPHFHLVVTDGVFEIKEKSFQFHEASLAPDDIADTQDNIRKRVLALFAKRSWIENDEVEKMLENKNSGFSLDAKVRIESWDRQGLERLIKYCARPCFASENLRWNGPWLTYRLPKITHTGKTFIQLDPLEFIDKIAAFIPSPRRHRHHYHGVFAPNAPLRQRVAASAIQTPKVLVRPELQQTANEVTKASLTWAKLIARVYEVNPLLCTCGNEMKITAIVTDQAKIWRILTGIGWHIEAPDFDPPTDFLDREICQLAPGTPDGFPKIDELCRFESGPDPPHTEDYIDPPHREDHGDLSHWEDTNCLFYD
jgi:hypothetical protein